LRLIPNNQVWRPCDGIETAIAWQAAINRKDGPTCLLLSRQALTPFVRSTQQCAEIARGAYVLHDVSEPQAVLIATGSEVEIAYQAARELLQLGIAVRVVSMPCVEIFYQQDAAYRHSVLPTGLPRISLEAGVSWFWRAVVGERGVAIGIDSFGESAPATQLYQYFQMTPGHVADAVLALLKKGYGC
jgi:transketolase